jgi:hypothetical protein
MRIAMVGCFCLLTLGGTGLAADPAEAPAADEAADDVTVTRRWSILYNPGRRTNGVRPLPPNGKIQPLPDLQFTGPEPGDPFVLGEFAADGEWGIADGGIVRVNGNNAALKLGRAENFELDGTIEMGEEGGWFLLVGWNEGLGYSIINIGFRESPSPWFITGYRGGAAIAEAHQHVTHHEWRGEQAFNLTVKDQVLDLHVGKVHVLKGQQLADYSVGDVILGVYDTRYGPRPIRIRALRIRALESAMPEEAVEAQN